MAPVEELSSVFRNLAVVGGQNVVLKLYQTHSGSVACQVRVEAGEILLDQVLPLLHHHAGSAGTVGMSKGVKNVEAPGKGAKKGDSPVSPWMS